MATTLTETETVIKRVIPYLVRRGYEIETALDFETATAQTDRYTKGYIDILVAAGKQHPQFLIEAKRRGKKLTNKDRDQALAYGRSQGVLFVIVTNGSDIQAFNTEDGEAIKRDGRLVGKLPSKAQLGKVVNYLKVNRDAKDAPLHADTSLPFCPGLPLTQLNGLSSRCHNAIRSIEKDEIMAFADVSKIMFLMPFGSNQHSREAFPQLETPARMYETEEARESVRKHTETFANFDEWGERRRARKAEEGIAHLGGLPSNL
ncbi:type I restriction enzyme HsdR N-terminal domain-containing protein [Dermatobacter hominis]|uniref:type I restriction enzyme HsdR N-terminal domain-containing protein n=1 Tax=Dermatobacter hominis TaxID=2884263 RepID=UPI001D11DA0A|nr:type I restriction enzyme HsdR N-terminal domain-containing protein [Dermatobacter hominis]UDY34534.1 type I restriction enzyme HsdR N-terminal domain-containing protein [Dermatobacter hominis]